MKNSAKVSIIIPAYNAERTLRRCVRSLQEQTIHDIVIIIVNDGSTDATPAIADGLSAADARIVVIHKANGGCYMARYSGVEQVQTPYFGFVDADDWVESNMFERMLSVAEEKDLDIVECGVFGKGRLDDHQQEFYLSKEDVLKDYVYPRMMIGLGTNTVWNKIYRKEMFGTDFIRGFFSTWEDLVWNLQLFSSASRIGVLHDGLYHYEITANSSVRNFSLKNIEGLRNTIEARSRLAVKFDVKDNDSSLSIWIVHNIRNMLLSAAVAPASSAAVRKGNVQSLLSLPALVNSLKVLGSFYSKETIFVSIASWIPVPMTIFAIRTIRKLF